MSGILAGAVLLAPMLVPAPASGTSVLGRSDAIDMDCSGWSVAAMPFTEDGDGDGQATVTVVVKDGNLGELGTGAELANASFTYPVGTTHDLAGTFTSSPTVNNLQMLLADELGAEPYVGSCLDNDWRSPGYGIQAYIAPGDTEFFVATFASCYGTTINWLARDESGATIGEWSTVATTRVQEQSFVTLTVSTGLHAGSYQMDAVCGTFASPRSGMTSRTFDVAAPVPTTAPTAPSAEATSATPDFTG